MKESGSPFSHPGTTKPLDLTPSTSPSQSSSATPHLAETPLTNTTISPPSPRRQGVAQTASRAGPSARKNPSSTITSPNNPRIPSPSFQPPYPSPSPALATSPNSPDPHVRVTSPTRWSLRNALIGGSEFASPFRNRSGTGGSSITVRGRPRRPSAARLWNPSNSTPRGPSQSANSNARRQQQRSEEVIAIPLQHPEVHRPREGAGAGGEYPLLTLPEQRASRHSGSTRASLQIDRSGSDGGGSNRVSLPRSVSIELAGRRSGEPSPALSTVANLDKGKGREGEEVQPRVTGLRKRGQSINYPKAPAGISFDKGKRREMDSDLERGPDTRGHYEENGTSNLPRNGSNTSLPDGIGAALSSTNTSIIGSDGPPMNPAEDWGPQHPCFPHMNPHVPLSSPLYQSTRIIRIRRDWMIEGDLAPTFSNLYPEILDPAGVSEQEFRTMIERINNELIPAFNPFGFRNMLDNFLGLLTGWVWDDMGFTAVKSRLSKVEQYLEEWNREMEGRSKDTLAPRIVPLRRTGYMNLDIQVPDPEISYPASIPADERTATGLSRISQ